MSKLEPGHNHSTHARPYLTGVELILKLIYTSQVHLYCALGVERCNTSLMLSMNACQTCGCWTVAMQVGRGNLCGVMHHMLPELV